MQRLVSVFILLMLISLSSYADNLSLDDFVLRNDTDSLGLGQKINDSMIFQGKKIQVEKDLGGNEWKIQSLNLDQKTQIFYFSGSRKINRIITRNHTLETNRRIGIGNNVDDLLKVYKSFLFTKKEGSWILFYQWEEDSFITSEYYLEFKITKNNIIEEIELGIASQ